jgi:hypothetical protein
MQSKTDLVFDSIILSDFYLVGKNLYQTVELTAFIQGFGLFPCSLIFCLLTNTGTGDDYEKSFISIDESLIRNFDYVKELIYILALVGFLMQALSHYNISYGLSEVGQSNKLKNTLIIIGAPLLTSTLLLSFLFGIPILMDVKLIFELMLIVIAYIELADLEQ